jgi:hypothetical protein
MHAMNSLLVGGALCAQTRSVCKGDVSRNPLFLSHPVPCRTMLRCAVLCHAVLRYDATMCCAVPCCLLTVCYVPVASHELAPCSRAVKASTTSSTMFVPCCAVLCACACVCAQVAMRLAQCSRAMCQGTGARLWWHRQTGRLRHSSGGWQHHVSDSLSTLSLPPYPQALSERVSPIPPGLHLWTSLTVPPPTIIPIPKFHPTCSPTTIVQGLLRQQLAQTCTLMSYGPGHVHTALPYSLRHHMLALCLLCCCCCCCRQVRRWWCCVWHGY